MTPIGWKLAALLIFTLSPAVSSTVTDPRLQDYLVQVLQSLVERYPGIHRCVFYGTQHVRSFDNTLGALLQDSRLDFVPKLVLAGSFKVERDELIRYPLVVLIEGEKIYANYESFLANLRKVLPNSKTVVLLTDLGDFWRYKKVLELMNEFEVVFVDVKGWRMVVASMGIFTSLDFLLEPDKWFQGTISSRYNLENQPLKYTKRGAFRIVDKIWMEESAALMNTTALEMKHSCPLAVGNPFDNCYWDYIKEEGIDIDLSRIKFDSVHPDPNFHCMTTNIMIGDVIAVPRTALSMMQLFTMPFNWKVWTSLALILVIAEILYLAFPKTIRNDPILMVLCGYEKHDLHRAGLREKFLLMPLIVLMFFASCAYETKLLSMMTCKPASRNIRTVQQLIESGIKIKSNLLTDTLLPRDSTIRNSLINSTVNYTNLDMVHAYLLPQSWGKYMATRHYDPTQRIHRYVLLDETYLVYQVSFWVARRNPLREVFSYTMTGLIESGIFDLADAWEKAFYAKSTTSGGGSDAVLYFADFEPVWIVFAAGIAACFVTFALEVAVRGMMKVKVIFFK